MPAPPEDDDGSAAIGRDQDPGHRSNGYQRRIIGVSAFFGEKRTDTNNPYSVVVFSQDG
jgi:hypothetical protein